MTLAANPVVAKERERTLLSRPAIALIIPAYNEEESIAHVLRDVPPGWVEQVLVVDNGSTDHTAELAAAAGAQVIPHPEHGYGAACLAGIAALPPDASIVVFLDADYSDFPEDLVWLVEPILQGRADLVISTRTLALSTRSVLSPVQRWGNRLACTLMRWFFGACYTDLGPFRAIRRDALAELGMADRNFGWTVEMQIRAALAGLRVVEIPVRYRVRIGRSKISGTVKGSIMAGAKILYTILKYALLSRRPSRGQ